jgi:hypothetical protein
MAVVRRWGNLLMSLRGSERWGLGLAKPGLFRFLLYFLSFPPDLRFSVSCAWVGKPPSSAGGICIERVVVVSGRETGWVGRRREKKPLAYLTFATLSSFPFFPSFSCPRSEFSAGVRERAAGGSIILLSTTGQLVHKLIP